MHDRIEKLSRQVYTKLVKLRKYTVTICAIIINIESTVTLLMCAQNILKFLYYNNFASV